ncbi:predicted protein [Uncinocarpus reesii 1704]|uniref:Uncharacterized protein n=1 Tax=Uncinocarpus reesii (strain UAMH 1704) TaxID=336963 RepID=C4JYR6_UNCRE|nr:uncharacterized protein UREG_07317 [Uncinocarpus reesii 1704]EEP82452.1 predicted protein [Uncinocarpus reesii 1704]
MARMQIVPLLHGSGYQVQSQHRHAALSRRAVFDLVDIPPLTSATFTCELASSRPKESPMAFAQTAELASIAISSDADTRKHGIAFLLGSSNGRASITRIKEKAVLHCQQPLIGTQPVKLTCINCIISSTGGPTPHELPAQSRQLAFETMPWNSEMSVMLIEGQVPPASNHPQ